MKGCGSGAPARPRHAIDFRLAASGPIAEPLREPEGVSGVKQKLLAVLRRLTPPFVLAWRARRLRAREHARFRALPNSEVFSRIYEERLWGGPEGEFFSGSGSDANFGDVYVAAVHEFAATVDARRIVDLGCGDFRIGNRVRQGFAYVGVDVVPALIAVHERKYGNEDTRFVCLDLTTDPLPPGDVALLRQVLQHLSNNEILRVLKAAEQYPYLIVTEHFPASGQLIEANRDKPHGPDIRIADGSAVCVDLPPFNRIISRVLCEVEDTANGSIIRTVLIDQRA